MNWILNGVMFYDRINKNPFGEILNSILALNEKRLIKTEVFSLRRS